MGTLTYFGPDGVRVPDPTAELLERIVFRERGTYWHVGSGESSLSVAVLNGPKSYSLVPGEPSLMFFLDPKHGFFFVYFSKTLPGHVTQSVPFAGGECRPWVRHNIGGDCFYAPRACFVSRVSAWEIVQEFVRSRARSPAVRWADRSSLDFPSPLAGDPVPAKSDLA